MHPVSGSIHSARKPELGRRVALATLAGVHRRRGTVWAGPTPRDAVPYLAADCPVGAECVVVRFSTLAGSGGLALNATAACPSGVLPVYCDDSELAGGAAGFELLAGSVAKDGAGTWWRPARQVRLLREAESVLLTSGPGLTAPTRVRYAYADWPVTSVRNGGTGGHSLPARVFDIAVAPASSGGGGAAAMERQRVQGYQ